MKVWIYTTTEIEEFVDLEEKEEFIRNSDIKAKKGDIILVYRGKPYSNIAYIYKADNDAYKNPYSKNGFDVVINLNNKIEIPNPLKISQMRDDSLLGKWNIVRKNFMGSFFEVPIEEWERIKSIISDKNPELEDKIENLENRELGIRYVIKKMLENYLKAKNNPKLAKELVSFANGGDFHEYLIKIAKQFEKGDYGTFGLFGAANDLQPIPYVYIFNKKYSHWQIIFLFREDMKGVYLSLGQQPWTMEGRLKEKGLNIQKFSQEFNDYLLNDASEARTKLKNLTTIPNEYLEKIDLGSENAISADSREAGNVIAKYYTLENLPSEDELISDFKETLSLYKKLADEPNISEHNIRDPLELIFRNFTIAKQRNQKPKDHDVSKAFLDIKNAILTIANTMYPEKEYNSQAYYQVRGSWFKSPYIYIENKAHKDIFGHWDQHFVGFWFNEDLQGLTLSLSQSKDYARNFLKIKGKKDSKKELQIYIKNHYNCIKNELKNLNVREDLFLDSEIDNMSDLSIYGKHYDKNNLPTNEEIISDFKDLFYLYSKLKPDFGKIGNVKFKIIENKNEIKESQNKLESILKIGAQKKDNMYFLSDSGIWMSSGKNPDSFYNLFGVGKNHSTTPNDTIVEINFPFDGINRNISGAFAKDDACNVFLLHRGNLGGKYAGKSLLEENYDGEWVDVDDGKTLKKFINVGNLDEPDFPEKLKNFVFEVCKIKKGTECVKNQNFFNYLSEKGYLFDQKLVENFLLSLKVKPFVILTGNSGTGKTKLAQLFAQYLSRNNQLKKYIETYQDVNPSSIKYNAWTLNKEALKQLNIDYNKKYDIKINDISTKAELISPRLKYDDPDKKIQSLLKEILSEKSNKNIKIEILISDDDSSKYEIVPVGANWTENRHIVGFYNVITEKYQKTSSLNLILDAKNDLTEAYFLILDEMNLSHVERYFSDFLSVMESQETMPLHDNKEKKVSPLHDNEKIGVPKNLDLPPNLLVIGTVNVDETTYMFSPKVLDRANTIEFLTHSPLEFMQNQFNQTKPSGNLKYLQDPLSDAESNIRTCSIDDLKELMKNIETKENKSLWDVVSEEINKIYRELKKAGFDFGFRVINEIMRFMYVAWKYEGEPQKWENWERYFDAQIKQKMLPKLHGSQRTLQEVINNLFEICYGYKIDIAPRLLSEKELTNIKYPTAALKLREMDKVLYEQRYVAFIN